MRYFPCPTGTRCGPRHIIAQPMSRTYVVNSSSLDEVSNICNHEIRFSGNAGATDLLVIKFLDSVPGTKVNFVVGNNFETAKGEKIDYLFNKVIKVGFPLSIWMSVDHTISQAGSFSFEFYYVNNQPGEDDMKQVIGYEVETIIIGK